MKKIDVTKPAVIMGKNEYKVNYKCTIDDYFGGVRHVFSVTDEDEDEFLSITNSEGEIIYGFAKGEGPIINFTETPEIKCLNWDKPIRFNDMDGIIIGNYLLSSGDRRLLISKHSDGFKYGVYNIHDPKHINRLENYEPERKYFVEKSVLGDWDVYENGDRNRLSARFTNRKDAEAFKKLKESGVI